MKKCFEYEVNDICSAKVDYFCSEVLNFAAQYNESTVYDFSTEVTVPFKWAISQKVENILTELAYNMTYELSKEDDFYYVGVNCWKVTIYSENGELDIPYESKVRLDNLLSETYNKIANSLEEELVVASDWRIWKTLVNDNDAEVFKKFNKSLLEKLG